MLTNMKFLSISVISLLAFSTQGAPAYERSSALPFELPFRTSGSSVLSSDGNVVKVVGTNWPGHQEAMIPEGLQYSSIHDIVTKIKDFGLNTIRLTFAIEMIDNILDNGGDVALSDALDIALGSPNATKVLDQILSHNPSFTARTTRLEIFDAVANELSTQGIYVHLDNHVSKGIWCCGLDDGNAWFGDTYFDVDNWVRAWGYISAHAAAKWPSFSSAGLRNEFRKPSGDRGEPYDWYTWYVHMTAAAEAVHTSAPDTLMYFSGLDYDTKIGDIPLGKALNGTAGTSTEGKTAYFTPSNFAFQNKIVLELHKYDFENTQVSCEAFQGQLNSAGYIGLGGSSTAVKYKFPMLLTEWGFIQDGIYYNITTYNECLIQFMANIESTGWMQWALGGSYYQRTRNGASPQDDDESWGLLNHDWSAVRSQETVDNSLTPMIKAILE